MEQVWIRQIGGNLCYTTNLHINNNNRVSFWRLSREGDAEALWFFMIFFPSWYYSRGRAGGQIRGGRRIGAYFRGDLPTPAENHPVFRGRTLFLKVSFKAKIFATLLYWIVIFLGIYSLSSGILNNVTFLGNRAQFGGGIKHQKIIFNLIFVIGLAVDDSSVPGDWGITGCTFQNNFANISGGGILFILLSTTKQQ